MMTGFQRLWLAKGVKICNFNVNEVLSEFLVLLGRQPLEKSWVLQNKGSRSKCFVFIEVAVGVPWLVREKICQKRGVERLKSFTEWHDILVFKIFLKLILRLRSYLLFIWSYRSLRDRDFQWDVEWGKNNNFLVWL